MIYYILKVFSKSYHDKLIHLQFVKNVTNLVNKPKKKAKWDARSTP